MQMRTILVSIFIELDNGVHDGVPIDALLARAEKRQVSAQDFVVALQTALHDGDLIESSPGLVRLTASGTEFYRESLSLN